jgi:hypothetical protein
MKKEERMVGVGANKLEAPGVRCVLEKNPQDASARVEESNREIARSMYCRALKALRQKYSHERNELILSAQK